MNPLSVLFEVKRALTLLKGDIVLEQPFEQLARSVACSVRQENVQEEQAPPEVSCA